MRMKWKDIRQQLTVLQSGEEQRKTIMQKHSRIFRKTYLNMEEFLDEVTTKFSEKTSQTIQDGLVDVAKESFEIKCQSYPKFFPAVYEKFELIRIVYVVRGKITCHINQKNIVLKNGQFCIISPGVEHAFSMMQEYEQVIEVFVRPAVFGNTFSMALVEQDVLSDFLWTMSYTKYSNQVVLYFGDFDSVLRKWLFQLYEADRLTQEKSNLLLRSYLFIFLGEVLRRHAGELKLLKEEKWEASDVPAILRDMWTNLGRVSLEWLAEKWNTNSNEMNYRLKMQTGYSYFRIVSNMRMESAANHLLATSDSIEKIMELVGFYDITSFYRGFKEKYGRTPQQYRNNGALPYFEESTESE